MTGLPRDWLLATRPWSFTMTTISVTVGAALATLDGAFSWWLYFLTLIGTVLMHAGSNLINDYHDVRQGVDNASVPTARYRPHPLMEGRLTPCGVRLAAYSFYLFATAIGLFLAITRGWPVLWLGVVGIAAGISYTAPPLNYKYKALGEGSVFLMWGPLMVSGAYYVQAQAASSSAVLVSLPFGMLVALVLLANNMRDIAYDDAKGIRTLPILLGRRRSITLYLALIVTAYAAVAAMSLLGPLERWSLVVLLSAPLAAKLLRQMATDVPLDADAQTAKLNTLFGVLLLLSLVAQVWL